MTQPTYDWNSNPDAVERAKTIIEGYGDQKLSADELCHSLSVFLDSIKVDPVEAAIRQLLIKWQDGDETYKISHFCRDCILAGIELGKKEGRDDR